MNFAFKHMPRSESVEQAAFQAINDVLAKFELVPTSCNVTFSVNKSSQSVHLSAHFRDGYQLELEQGEESLYKAIELVSDKLDRKLVKHKEKMNSHRDARKDAWPKTEESDNDTAIDDDENVEVLSIKNP